MANWGKRFTQEWLDDRQKREAGLRASIESLDKAARKLDAESAAINGPGPTPAPPKANKYHNEKTDGYDSKREAKRASDLKLMQEAGVIRDLREQVPFELIPKNADERAVTYICDFVYEEFANGDWSKVHEDCKGMRTRDYIIKRKLMRHVHGIRVRET